MSVQIIAWAYGQEVGSPTEKAVLIALANAANHHTGECFPHVERLASETEFSYSAVKKALVSLVDKGFISRSRQRRDDGSWSGYFYEFPHLGINQLPGTSGSQPGLRDSHGPGLPGGSLEKQPEVNLQPRASSNELARERNGEVWKTLAEIFGEPTTRSARSKRGMVVRSLTNAGATHDEVMRRAKSWPRHFKDATLTETALEKHWDALGRPPLRVGQR